MTLSRYITGFALSLAITCVSFGAVWLHMAKGHEIISHPLLAMLVLALAIVQLVVQLIYFVHLGHETKTRDTLALMLAGFLVVFIVGGTLWIMANLKHNGDMPYHGEVTPQTSTD